MSYYDIPPPKEVKCGLKVKGYKGYIVSVVAGNIESPRWLWAEALARLRGECDIVSESGDAAEKMNEENSD